MHFLFGSDTVKIDDSILDKLYKLSLKAFRNGEIPVSCCILDKNGKIISWEINKRQKKYDILGHSEILCIQKVEKKIKDWRLDGYSMVVTLEPCDMCSMVISKSRLDHVYYILDSNSNESSDLISIKKDKLKVSPEYEEKFRKLLTDFFDNKR